MIKDLLKYHGPALTEEVELLEASLPNRLPDDYRTWLQAYGGAYLLDSVPLPTDEGNALLRELMNPRQAWGFYPGWGNFFANIPLEFLAVGYGDGGALCICLTDGDYGSIWFADFDLAQSILEEDERSMEIMMRLADNWEAFLSSR